MAAESLHDPWPAVSEAERLFRRHFHGLYATCAEHDGAQAHVEVRTTSIVGAAPEGDDLRIELDGRGGWLHIVDDDGYRRYERPVARVSAAVLPGLLVGPEADRVLRQVSMWWEHGALVEYHFVLDPARYAFEVVLTDGDRTIRAEMVSPDRVVSF
jgi:hypothetical protein